MGDLFRVETGILDLELFSLDIALHDLAARILEIPVSQMINPQAVHNVGIYDGAIYMI